MLIQINKTIDDYELEKIKTVIRSYNCQLNDVSNDKSLLFMVLGDTSKIDQNKLLAFKHVEKVTRLTAPFKKASRQAHPDDTVIELEGIKIGGNNPLVFICGPCSVEGKETTLEIAKEVKKAGANMFRGGAFKPRTSPYSFQGLGQKGLDILSATKKVVGLPIVTEIMSEGMLDEFIDKADILQIGARNMQNFSLLKAVGHTNKPVLLKRGLANTIEEWLMSAEYIMSCGNNQVILCERGIRTFEKYTRNTLDLSVIPIVKKLSHLPIIIDPSHATGNRDLILPMSLAAVAAGCDGLLIEAHTNPVESWTDGNQTVDIPTLTDIIVKCHKIARAINRE